MVYVDDGIIISKKNSYIDNTINKLKEIYQLANKE